MRKYLNPANVRETFTDHIVRSERETKALQLKDAYNKAHPLAIT
jgi:hypothetical protein